MFDQKHNMKAFAFWGINLVQSALCSRMINDILINPVNNVVYKNLKELKNLFNWWFRINEKINKYMTIAKFKKAGQRNP